MEENNATMMGKQLHAQLSTSIKGSFAFAQRPSAPRPCRALCLHSDHGDAPAAAAWKPWESCSFGFWKWELGFPAGGKQPLCLPGFPNVEKILINFVRKHFVMRVSTKIKNPTHIFFFFSEIPLSVWQPHWSPSQACLRQHREASLSLLPFCWLLFSCLINYLPS